VTISPSDVTRAVALALDTLAPAVDADWEVPALGLSWSVWETVEHMSDDLFCYAGQLGPSKPSLTAEVPFGYRRPRDDGPLLTIYVDRAKGAAAQLPVLESCGSLLAAMVTAAPPNRLSYHSYGPSDPAGFAAMGVVEVLAHMYDIAGGLGLDWSPPSDLCQLALDRLFPAAPSGFDPWPTLLWATGRGALPGHAVQTAWRWDGSPR
jgi:hypothetical protein